MVDLKRLKDTCRLMRETGTDNSQYVLIRVDDLEELMEAWEQNTKTLDWARDIVKTALMTDDPEIFKVK